MRRPPRKHSIAPGSADHCSVDPGTRLRRARTASDETLGRAGVPKREIRDAIWRGKPLRARERRVSGPDRRCLGKVCPHVNAFGSLPASSKLSSSLPSATT
jgi:hypothetical protein